MQAIAETCKPIPVHWPGVFGNGIQIGEPAALVVSRLRRDRDAVCEFDNSAVFQCRYRDGQGIDYDVFDKRIEVIEAGAAAIAEHRLSIAGVANLRTIADLPRLQANLPVPLSIVRDEAGGTTASTGLCLLNIYEWFELYLVFDARGKLMTVGARLDSVRD